MTNFVVALTVFAACVLLSQSTVIPTSQIVQGFNSDGFAVVKNVTYNSFRGFVAQSLNTTLLSSGQHKLAYYVEGVCSC